MSIVWLESFFDNSLDANVFLFQKLNIVIYLNMISCLCFMAYCLLYKMDLNMRKPPSIILLIFRPYYYCKNVWRMFIKFSFSYFISLLFNVTYLKFKLVRIIRERL